MKRREPPVFPKLNQQEMAAFLAINDVRLQWAERRKIIERDTDGSYRPEIVTRQWLEYERSPRARSRGRVSSAFERERAKLTKLRAEEVQRRLSILDGNLVSGDGIIATAKTVCMRIRSKLQAAIPRIARACYHAPNVNEALKNARSEFDVVIAELATLEAGAAVPAGLEVVNDDDGGDAEE